MSKRNRHKRRQATEPPMLVERLQRHDQGHEDFPRLSYEEAKWPYLSPRRREAHNRLRQARGLPTIPPPAVDMYVPPKAPLIKPFDPTDREFVQSARDYLGSTLMGGGKEGFTINGREIK